MYELLFWYHPYSFNFSFIDFSFVIFLPPVQDKNRNRYVAVATIEEHFC